MTARVHADRGASMWVSDRGPQSRRVGADRQQPASEVRFARDRGQVQGQLYGNIIQARQPRERGVTLMMTTGKRSPSAIACNAIRAFLESS